jgi:hypothetical protein
MLHGGNLRRLKRFGLVMAVWICFCAVSQAQVNSWTNPVSGAWESNRWSLGILPGPGQAIQITNAGFKAVAIWPSTAQNFSETVNVSSINVESPPDSFNLLLLNYFGFVVPLVSGEVLVGTNATITALASMLNVSSNSGPGDLSIFGAFNEGEQAIVNAHVINLGDVTNAGAGFGTYNQTNGTIIADEVSLANSSTFNQFDGTNAIGTLWMGAANSSSNYGEYNMANGALTADSIEIYRGDFNQAGGSVAASLGLGATTYTLSEGILNLPGITIPNVPYSLRNPPFYGMVGNASLLQTGGTNFCNGSIEVYDTRDALINVPFWGPGSYVLSNGVLCVSSTVRSWMSSFEQWGGWHTNAGTEVAGDTLPDFEIRTGSFILGGGNLITPSISVDLADFSQSGGTNYVSGEVDIGKDGSPASFTLSGGLLTDLTTFVDGSNSATPGGETAIFTQSGGTHIVTNLLRLSGPPPGSYQPPFSVTGYVLSNGVLNAGNIQVDGGAFFEHDGGTLTTSGLLNFGYGAWNERTTGQQFGELLLSAPGSNATFSLPSGSCIVRFGNSSSVAWSNQAKLLIENWNGALNGGGNHQVFFGSDASGLTAQQLSQIQFKNPSGVIGNLPTRILSTGEIVPSRIMLSHRAGNSLVLEWSSGSVLQTATNVAGPYQDVGSASSPYAIKFNEAHRFFRVRE